MKKRSFEDYGWSKFARPISGKETPDRTVYLKDCLSEIIDLDDKTHFLFTKGSDDVGSCFRCLDLMDGILSDLQTERAVITRTSESNRYLRLFYRIRDGFAHGKFILKINENNEKMVIIQDDDSYNVTGRIVIKLSTILELIKVIDRNKLIIG